MPMSELNEVDVSEVEGLEPLVVVLWAPWESYHARYFGHVMEASRDFEGRAQFRRLNAERPEARPFVESWKIVNVPALALIQRGQHVETLIGVRPVGEIIEFLDKGLRRRP
jgi:thioredoxin-like negative regulator of GroEL